MNVLETIRADDFVEYFIIPSNSLSSDKLLDLQNKLSSFVSPWTENYIWHKDEFILNVHTEQQPDESEVDTPSLHGVIHFGENIDDEWFVVHILKKVSENFDVFIRIIDSDGEFLLIDAADQLPKWMKPENCEKRVHLHKGVIRVLPISVSPKTASHDEIISFLNNENVTEVEKMITKFIDARITKFSSGLENLLHKSRVYLPVKIAALLDVKPSLIAAAVRAFCHQDIIDMRVCRKMEHFPPNNLVSRLVTFTKFLYAMICHENCNPVKSKWNLPLPSNPEFKEHQLGYKIACGFEILVTKCDKKLQSNLTLSKKWNQYIQVLKRKGYFKDLIENSKEYVDLEKKARIYFLDNIGVEDSDHNNILNILQTVKYDVEEMKQNESKLPPSDDEKWMNINEEEFNKLLADRFGFKELNVTNSPDVLSSAISKFLNSVSDVEGVEGRNEKTVDQFNKMDIDEENNHNISFNPEDFMSSVEKMLDIMELRTGTVAFQENPNDDSNDSEEYDSDDEETTEDLEMKAYMNLMDKELNNSTLSKSFVNKSGDGSLDSIDIDSNALANILKSYEEQFGGTGPAGNLLHTMGLKLNVRKSQ